MNRLSVRFCATGTLLALIVSSIWLLLGNTQLLLRTGTTTSIHVIKKSQPLLQNGTTKDDAFPGMVNQTTSVDLEDNRTSTTIADDAFADKTNPKIDESSHICIVHRWTNHYGGSTSEFVQANHQCYCQWHEPCTNFFDDEEYKMGSVVATPTILLDNKDKNGTVTLDRDPKHFGKLLSIVKAWQSSHACDIIMFSDMDVAFSNLKLDVRSFFNQQHASTSPPDLVFARQPISGINAGVYALRTSSYAAHFLKEWWNYEADPISAQLHGDQGALYDLLLRRVIPKPAPSTNHELYVGQCRSEPKYRTGGWAKQTGCFNEWMRRLGHFYPDWDDAWPHDKDRGGGGFLVVTNGPKLEGFPFENYGDRPEAKYAQLGYAPFNYSHVLDVCTEPQDLMVHKGFPSSLQQRFHCSEGGWLAKDVFAHVPGNRMVFSQNIRKIVYGHKQLAEVGQAWLNKDNHTTDLTRVWNIPASWKLPSMNGLPGFVGVGCGHCGNPSFYNTLMQHPQMVPGRKQEVLYLNSRREDRTAQGYAAEFPVVQDWEMTGEFSPYYLGNPGAPELLRRLSPQSKILLLLQDPLEQCQSAYGYDAVKEAMLREPSCRFHEILREKAPKIRKEWHYHPCDTQSHSMEGVQRWQNSTRDNNILLIDSKEFQSHPEWVLQRVEDFLGLPNFNGYFNFSGSPANAQRHKTVRVKDEVDANLPQAHCFDQFRDKIDDLLKPYRVVATSASG